MDNQSVIPIPVDSIRIDAEFSFLILGNFQCFSELGASRGMYAIGFWVSVDQFLFLGICDVMALRFP